MKDAVFAESYEARIEATPMPCGRCLPCRINASRVWQHRIILENYQHSDSVFVTLTYSEAAIKLLSDDLNPKELKNFLERLRRRLNGTPFRYFAVGERGTDNGRAHLHAILFGLSKLHRKQITDAWSINGCQKGIVDLGEVNVHSAGYIAGYCLKKLTKKGDERLYGLSPEYARSSRKEGGLGLKTIQDIGKDLSKKRYFKPEVINAFKYGKKSLPLGRYLTDKLSEACGVPEEERRRKLIEYQNGLVVKHLKKGEQYTNNIMSEKDQERLNQEKSFKIYRQKRALDGGPGKIKYPKRLLKHYRYYIQTDEQGKKTLVKEKIQ